MIFFNIHKRLTCCCSSLWSAYLRTPPPPSGAVGSDSLSTVFYLKIWNTSILTHAQGGSCLRLCSVWHGPWGRRRGEPPLLCSSIKERSGRPFIKNYWDIWTSDIKSLSGAQTSCVWGLNRSHKSTASLLDCRRVCNHRPPQKRINACMNLRPGWRNKPGWGVGCGRVGALDFFQGDTLF